MLHRALHLLSCFSQTLYDVYDLLPKRALKLKPNQPGGKFGYNHEAHHDLACLLQDEEDTFIKAKYRAFTSTS